MTKLTAQLLAWYAKNKRQMPWRDSLDPYAVWVSEIMLQQTQVVAVIPYYTRWMQLFPTIYGLAAADEQELLMLWEGLGYYQRARNLHQAAKFVVKEYGGDLPADFHLLRALPGVGEYTAAAIASFAFGQGYVALDGNLKRVFARLFAVGAYVDTPSGHALLKKLAEEHLPLRNSSAYNQALMDVGALVCLPRNPDCLSCPLKDLCQAFALGVQNELPRKKPKPIRPHQVQVAAVLVENACTLMRRRESKGLLGGLWEFPTAQVLDEASPELALPEAIFSACGLKIFAQQPLVIVNHAYTHFSVTCNAFTCEVDSGDVPDGWEWLSLASLRDFPMGKIDRAIANALERK